MADPIEIMARAMRAHRFIGEAPEESIMRAKTALAALEAAGFRIVSPETVTLSMTVRAVLCRDIEHGNMGEILAAALRAAPLHGKG